MSEDERKVLDEDIEQHGLKIRLVLYHWPLRLPERPSNSATDAIDLMR
jgi:hypothetical protein